MKITNYFPGRIEEIFEKKHVDPNQDVKFEDMIKNAINNISHLQQDADKQIQSFLNGEPVDLHNVMIALEKSNINFRLLTEIRNKALMAYEEIMKMPI